jgi:hypothetical protein
MQPGHQDEIQELRDELAGMRAELEARTHGSPIWRRTVTRVRSFRRLTVVGIVALMLAVPLAVSASHLFSDVPTSNTYHTSVSRLVGAGLTGGCGGGKYCPNAAVTRGQMAAFLNRGLGRGTGGVFGDESWANLDYPGTLVAIGDVIAGGASGGTAHALVTGNINVWTDEPGVCPCEVQLFAYNPLTDESSPVIFDAIGADGVPSVDVLTPDPPPYDTTGPWWQANVAISAMFTVPSGALSDFELYAAIVPTTPASVPDETNGFVTGWVAGMQVVYVPFGADGDNPVPPATTGGNGPSRERGGVSNTP